VPRLKDRRQVRAVLTSLKTLLPVPWDIDRFVVRLAAHRQRAIELVAWTFPADEDSASGVWIPSAKADYIFYDAAASPARREQIIGHELGHILLDHTPRLADAPGELVEALAPSLTPELAHRVLSMSRTGYTDDDEAAAEFFGTSLSRIGTSKPFPADPDELGRLTEALR
jgi:hypothetical protein